MAPRAPFANVKRRTFFGVAMPRRKLLPRRADRDVPGADLFCGGRPADAIRGRLRPDGLANRQRHDNEKRPKRVHFVRSRRYRFSTAAPYCPLLAPGPFPRVRSSILRRRLGSVGRSPVRQYSATSVYIPFRPNSNAIRIERAPFCMLACEARRFSTSGPHRLIPRQNGSHPRRTTPTHLSHRSRDPIASVPPKET